MRFTGLLFIGAAILCLVQAEDVTCSKKTKKKVKINEGDSFSFSTQEGDAYVGKTKCQVVYKKMKSCPSIRFSCTDFDLTSKKTSCKGGDKIAVVADGKTTMYCQNSAPDITTSSNILKVKFTSNKKQHGAGAVCTVECVSGEQTTAAPTTAGSPTSPASGSSNAAYCALDENHTMCKYKGPSSSCSDKTIFKTLSAEGKAAILDRHNLLRRKVAKGQETGGINAPQPAAANMKKMVWNTELEDIAQRWADQCEFGHDSVRTKLDGTRVGQNAYIGYSSAEAAETAVQGGMADPAQSWYDEVTSPGFDSQSISPFKFSSGAGHYTQVVWAESEEIGCAVVYFKDTSAPLDYNNLVICNYASAGNFQGAVMYQAGAACSACPTGYTCEDGLCAK